MLRIKLAVALCGLPLVLASTGCSHLHKKSCPKASCAVKAPCAAPCANPVDSCVMAEQKRIDCATQQGACQEQVQQMRSQVDETLHSQVSLGVSQDLEFGALQVDYDKLQDLMADRQRQVAEDKAVYDEIVREQQKAYREARAQQLRDYLDQLPEQYAKGCCSPSVHVPPPPPLKLPEPPEPPKMAIHAAEIPFVVPVTLKVGVDGQNICNSTVRRVKCAQQSAPISCNRPTTVTSLNPPPAPAGEEETAPDAPADVPAPEPAK